MSYLNRIKTQIETELGNPFDLVVRPFRLRMCDSALDGFLFFIRGIVNEVEIEETLINSLQTEQKALTSDDSLSRLATEALHIKNFHTHPVEEINPIIQGILEGNTIIVIDGKEEVLSAVTSEWVSRAVTTPESQRVLRGPNIAFNEDYLSNIALLRGIIKNKNLTFDQYSIGEKTQTKVCLVYLRDMVDQDILKEIRKRVANIDASQVLDSNYIEEYIHDDFFTPFPLVLNTDRPDMVAAELMSRKIAIIVEGTAYTLVGPAPLITFLQTSDDYYFKWNLFFNRILRLISIVIGVYIPALYIALSNFHPGFIPFDLLVSLAGQRENKPLPLVIEVILFIFILTIIVESALRLQKSLVLSISLLGTIILGQAAIESGIVQPATLMVVSVSFVLGFASPVQTLETPIRILRYLLVVTGAIMGLFGIIITTIVLVFHLSNLRTFGIPYLAPLAPFNKRDQKDTLVRFSLTKIINNKKSLHKEEPYKKK